ncbi:hypothetical protein KI387_006296, partial [Taxus chinensis]
FTRSRESNLTGDREREAPSLNTIAQDMTKAVRDVSEIKEIEAASSGETNLNVPAGNEAHITNRYGY